MDHPLTMSDTITRCEFSCHSGFRVGVTIPHLSNNLADRIVQLEGCSKSSPPHGGRLSCADTNQRVPRSKLLRKPRPTLCRPHRIPACILLPDWIRGQIKRQYMSYVAKEKRQTTRRFEDRKRSGTACKAEDGWDSGACRICSGRPYS